MTTSYRVYEPTSGTEDAVAREILEEKAFLKSNRVDSSSSVEYYGSVMKLLSESATAEIP